MDELEEFPTAVSAPGIARLATAMICVEPGDMMRAVCGRLGKEQLEAVTHHCLWCEDCRDELQAIGLLAAAGRPARGGVATGVGRRWAVAAAAGVALVMIGLWSQAGNGIRDDVVAVDDRVDVAARPAQMLVRQAGQERLTLVEADKLLVTVDALRMFLGATRSTVGGDDATAQDQLIAAIDAIESGDAIGASARLEQFGTEHDAFGTPLLGIARYIAGDDLGSAREALQFAVTAQPVDPLGSNSLYVAAVWCLGRLELVRGELDSTRAIWGQIADPDGTDFQRLAAAGLGLLTTVR